MPKFKKKQNNDHILILSTFLLLTLCIIIWLFIVIKKQNNFSTPQILPMKVIGNAKLTIVFNNGNRRIFEGNIAENETLVDVLNQVARAGSFSYKLNKENNLVSIGKLTDGNKGSWRWYINGKRINKSLDKIPIKSNDDILIKYELL